MTHADNVVASVRERFPDLTAEEEAAVRHHAETGITLYLRCKITDSDEKSFYFADGWDGLILGEDFTKPPYRQDIPLKEARPWKTS